MNPSRLRLALADDQALTRHGLRLLLEALDNIDIVIDVDDGELLLAELQRTRVDIIISDVRMPKYGGIEVTRWLRAHGDFTPMILLTTFDDPLALQNAVQAGAQGFLLKDADPEELRAAIDQVASGRTLFSTGSLDKIRKRTGTADEKLPQLTERELAVLRLVAGGYSNNEIGLVLSISGGTVKNHMTDIMSKLEARDRTHAVLKAISSRQL
jgi:DNA-binding NarL/FixJ family response regulator